MLKQIGTFVTAAGLCVSAADATTKPKGYEYQHQIPLSLGYMPSQMTNESVSQFHLALEKNTAWLFDKGHQVFAPSNAWTRAAYKYLVFPLVVGPFYKSLRMSTDQFGKASRIAALGGNPIYVDSKYETYGENYWAMSGKNILKSYIGLFSSTEYVDVMPAAEGSFKSDHTGDFISQQPAANLDALKRTVTDLRSNDAVDGNKASINADVISARNLIDNIYLKSRGKVLVRAGGLNARMAHTRHIEDALWYDGGAHLTILSNHSANKLAYAFEGISTFFQRNETAQTNSELGRISAAYKDMNIDFSWKEMAIHGAVAFLGSAEFWARLFEEASYISTGDTYVQAPEWKGIRLPNLGFYLTTYGPSYQLNTGYRWGQDWFFPVAMELVFTGPEKIFELTAGVRKQFQWMGLYIHGECTANFQNTAFGGKIAAGIKPFSNMYVDAGLRVDHVDTLEGERNIRSLEKDKWCPSITATIGLMF